MLRWARFLWARFWFRFVEQSKYATAKPDDLPGCDSEQRERLNKLILEIHEARRPRRSDFGL